MRKADLHSHTNFSDGTFSPEEVILEAKKKKLDCVAICDHDCVGALEEATVIAERENIEFVPGIELTAEKNGCEIHILGYYIDWKNPSLLELVERMQKNRADRIYEMVKKLNGVGVNIKAEDVFELSGKGSVGRLHLAYAIYNAGYTKYVGEAFRKYIGEGQSCYTGKFNLSPREAINAILKAGGVPVLAHPGVSGRDEFIPEYVKNGLRGIEVYHNDHKPAVASHYLKLAKDLGLLVTGGSDCHGLGKTRVLLGRVKIDYSLVEELKKAAGKS